MLLSWVPLYPKLDYTVQNEMNEKKIINWTECVFTLLKNEEKRRNEIQSKIIRNFEWSFFFDESVFDLVINQNRKTDQCNGKRTEDWFEESLSSTTFTARGTGNAINGYTCCTVGWLTCGVRTTRTWAHCKVTYWCCRAADSTTAGTPACCAMNWADVSQGK